jgi:hypothetical protein
MGFFKIGEAVFCFPGLKEILAKPASARENAQRLFIFPEVSPCPPDIAVYGQSLIGAKGGAAIRENTSGNVDCFATARNWA